jgi:hypothetical protein
MASIVNKGRLNGLAVCPCDFHMMKVFIRCIGIDG